MMQPLPEISRLHKLLEAFEAVPANHQKRGAARVIAELFSTIAEIDSVFDGQVALLSMIQSLPTIIVEQFPEKGRQAAALGTIDRLKEMFSPQNISGSFEQFIESTTVNRAFLSSTLLLLDDIVFDSNALSAKSPEIIDEVGALREKILQSNGLSEKSKLILDAQLELIERSLLRLDSSGVGPFRDSVFASIGRIYIELRSDPRNEKIAVRETLDDILRVYGLLEAGGTLVKIGAPAALKLIGSA